MDAEGLAEQMSYSPTWTELLSRLPQLAPSGGSFNVVLPSRLEAGAEDSSGFRGGPLVGGGGNMEFWAKFIFLI